ncbi:hypothetical protein H7F33_06000 [Pedobacter sp. PAMC26386]|nr:hypothetical protein H7F33_06000 [Pedobacter sp. PAMC26386]
MAILQENTLLAGIRGKIGNITIYQWKNKICARSNQSKPRKKRIRSTGQQAQQSKMAVLSHFLNVTAPFLRVGFKEKSLERNITANNAAKSANLFTGVKGEFPEQEINWDTILVSDGELTKPENVKVTISKNAYHFTWEKREAEVGSPDDRTIILLYSKVYSRFHACYSGARRSELKDTFTLPSPHIKDKTYEVFIAFKDVMSDAVSKSVYCGRCSSTE